MSAIEAELHGVRAELVPPSDLVGLWVVSGIALVGVGSLLLQTLSLSALGALVVIALLHRVAARERPFTLEVTPNALVVDRMVWGRLTRIRIRWQQLQSCSVDNRFLIVEAGCTLHLDTGYPEVATALHDAVLTAWEAGLNLPDDAPPPPELARMLALRSAGEP